MNLRIATMNDNEKKMPGSVAPQAPGASESSITASPATQPAGTHESARMNGTLEEEARQLHHSLLILRTTIEATDDGILVTDREGRVLHFNERYLRMWGVEREVTDVREHQQLLNL